MQGTSRLEYPDESTAWIVPDGCFGSLHDGNRKAAMQSLMQDLRYSLRQIRRSPGFMMTAVLTLALGVGANTAIFSLLDQALLRSLPVRAPEQLVILSAPGKMW